MMAIFTPFPISSIISELKIVCFFIYYLCNPRGNKSGGQGREDLCFFKVVLMCFGLLFCCHARKPD